ncbi:MAG: hypothetical protein ABRQ27_12015 [Clostridiaceae bacterium]
MTGLEIATIIVIIICVGYLYNDYKKNKENLIKKQEIEFEYDIQKRILLQLQRNGEELRIIKYSLIGIVFILVLILM